MNRVAIVTDTASNLNIDMAKEKGIFLVPYYINIGRESKKDLYEIGPEEFYENMRDLAPQTGVPAPDLINNLFEEIFSQGYEKIIVVTVSPKLSGMFNLMSLVASSYKDKVFVVDIDTVGMANAFLAIKGKSMLDEGKSFDEVYSYMKNYKKKTESYLLVDTFYYLMKGGRVSKVHAALGSLVKIKPLLKVEAGKLVVVSKDRGRKKALSNFAEEIKNQVKQIEGKYYFGIFHGNNMKLVEELESRISEVIDRAEVFLIEQLTSALGVHAGPDSIGIAILEI